MSKKFSPLMSAAVVVAALGYFVDIYDLVLFSIVRVPSLKSLGVEGQALFDDGVLLLNMQMAGMLVGGILWGILGDKKGRIWVLFGSILLYSIANLLNSRVTNIEQYAVLRFIAGIGLAGELGAGVTLVSEVLPKEIRGYGTMIVASVGVSGAILAGTIAEKFDWKTAYVIGGVLGLLLLAMRVKVMESHFFDRVKVQTQVKRGHFLSLFSSGERFNKYIKCIVVGLPIWYIIGILVTFSPEFAQSLSVIDEVNAGRAIMVSYFGLVIGDFTSGLLSQLVGSRRRVMLWFLTLCAGTISAYFASRGLTADRFYVIIGLLGFAAGYWAVFVTVGAEQFGTNLRATVATTVPNFVRGAVVPITLIFKSLKDTMGIESAGQVVGVGVLVIAFWAAWGLKETYGKDLDYVE